MRLVLKTFFINRFFFFILFLLSVADSYVQTEEWDELLQELMEEQVSEEDESDTWAELLDELVDLHEHPLNLNAVTREELQRLPFLEQKQAEAIIDYRTRYGNDLDMNEETAEAFVTLTEEHVTA